MNQPEDQTALRLALPKGRMQSAVLQLLADAGIHVTLSERGYRPRSTPAGLEVKLLKPQNIVQMLTQGSRDLGFAGADWVEEQQARDLVEVLDTGLDPVRVVAAAPSSLLVRGRLPDRPLVIASEYERITCRWMEDRRLNARFVRSYGATEVFPPEDADCIVDNTATGSTLAANDLTVVDELLRSSTRLYAQPGAMADPQKRQAIDRLALLLKSVLEARQRVMLEVNVESPRLQQVIDVLPAMQAPTVAPLHYESGYAVKAAVRCTELPDLIPRIKACGGKDLVVTPCLQIVP